MPQGNGTPAFLPLRHAKSILYGFKGSPDGESPYGDLIFDQKGALYGTTYDGGAYYFGSAFKLTPSSRGYTESVLWSFGSNSYDGGKPYAGLTLGKEDALYGTTPFGGKRSWGTVFKLTPSVSGYAESILWNFDNGKGGGSPFGALIFDGKGALYGTTVGGGEYGQGTVFKLTPSHSGYTETVVHSFCAKANCKDGAYPVAGVVFGNDGALYGTSFLGGSGDCVQNGQKAGCGTVFKLMPSGSAYRILYSFKNVPDGAYPSAGVTLDESGALYGTTMSGGNAGRSSDDAGTVYKLTPSQSKYRETVLHNFTGGNDGGNVNARVILGVNGVLFGTSYYGGRDNDGTVFKLTPPGYVERVFHSFRGGDHGQWLVSAVTLGSNGGLYGTTSAGGNCFNCGTVFELQP
ncbi:MAG: hypothetical protein JO078_12485 [Candidatus Eremiobacteraeota bacterium]|nr:hypothetical protein [Candidatus Eremiobacteraeota bacterium]